jgi:hypothetical protein
MSHHVFGDSGLGNLDTQFQQLAVNAGAPQRGLLRLIIRIRSRTCCGTRADRACRGGFSTPRTSESLYDARQRLFRP